MALGAAAAVAVVVVFAALIRPGPIPPQPRTGPIDPPKAVLPAPPVLTPPPPVNRAGLLEMAQKAAAAYAAGAIYPADVKVMSGQRFEAVMAFGCSGPGGAPGVEPARFTVDSGKKTITLTAQAETWTQAPWARELAGADQAATPPALIQGYWIARPWLADEGCPAPRPADPEAEPISPAEPTIGLMRVIGADASRLQGGLRPYETVMKATEEQLAASGRNYRLVLRGRIAALGNGEPVRCRAASVDSRPVCVIGVEIDRALFIDPATGETLAQWEH